MKYIRTALYVAVALAACARAGYGQTVTTGTITGVVQDAQGGVLPGVTVTAVHVPTGASYEGISQGDGRFSLLNVRVGGPYQVTAALSSFRNAVIADVTVRLGESTNVPVKLQLATVSETVVVSAETSPLFTGSKSGTTDSVGEAAIENLPTISRSIQDIARTSPYFNQIAADNFPSALSVAGSNVRYNSIQIDGAINNDVFSIASSAGTPGGSTETQPISLDAIQELQLVVSPYDVRQGMFSGGGVNAITRSGTNQFRGTTFYVARDQDLVGDGIDDKPLGTFSDKQFGATFGGPLVQNKAFVLGNVEWGRKSTPSGYSVSGSSGVGFGFQTEAQQIRDIAMNQYGFDPGGLDEFIRDTNNNKVFVRTDFNLGTHQLTLRHNYVDGVNDVGGQSNTIYKFPSNVYAQHSKTNSSVGQLNSRFGNAVNEFRATYQRIRDYRSFDDRFPAITIRLPGATRFTLGTDNSSQANELDQDTFELHDDFTLVRGNHTYTFGTHNEFFKFRNLFIQNLFGNYEFASIDKFAAGLAQGFSSGFSLTNDPEQAARFNVYQFGLYVGDQWRVAQNFTLTYGLRFDKPVFPDTPTANPASVANYNYRTDLVPSPSSWSPRAGFNWDLSGDGPRQQVRGGVGLFSGRNPFVYLSNQYGNTGIEFRRLSLTFNATANNVPFVADPDSQPTSVGSAGTNEIDVVDPNYQFPAIVRGNIGYDRDLFAGIVGNVELLFSNTVRDVNYSNLNLVAGATPQPDGRPRFDRINSTFNDVILLRNTDQGKSFMLTTQLERRFRNGWFSRGAYSYGRSDSVSDTTNSTARSTWINVYTDGNINNAPAAISNFDLRHRVVLSGSYAFDLRKAAVTLSMYYNGQTGRPYSYVFGTDVNNDGSGFNDLFYYPRESEVNMLGGFTYQNLVDYIEAGNCEDTTPGSIVKRNTCRAPWVNTLDFRAAVDVPLGRFRPEFTVDVLNLLNLFDHTNGQVYYAAFNDLVVNTTSVTAGKYNYTLATGAQPNAARYARDDLRSRWQAQLGLRLRF